MIIPVSCHFVASVGAIELPIGLTAVGLEFEAPRRFHVIPRLEEHRHETREDWKTDRGYHTLAFPAVPFDGGRNLRRLM
jgi:hypothetical protein